MKQQRDAAALAASLQTAASKPLPLPPHNQEMDPSGGTAGAPEPAGTDAPRRKNELKPKPAIDTVSITLRPDRGLHNRYVLAAADRTRKEGRVISAQQIMLEVLATGLR
jgi:hypothetical protein